MNEFATASESRTVTAHGIFNKNIIKDSIQREVCGNGKNNNLSIEKVWDSFTDKRISEKESTTRIIKCEPKLCE